LVKVELNIHKNTHPKVNNTAHVDE